jgi:hypothetical protein
MINFFSFEVKTAMLLEKFNKKFTVDFLGFKTGVLRE